MKRVLITGATGFVGRNLCAQLAAGPWAVRAMARASSDLEPLEGLDIELVPGDLTVPESLEEALVGIDQVVHLAAATQAMRADRYAVVNTEGTRTLAKAAEAAGVQRFVLASSLSAQGPSQPGQPHVSGGGEAPLTPYGHSKLDAERVLLNGFSGLNPVLLRPSVVYGPHDRELLVWLRFFATRLVPVVPGLEISFLHVHDFTRLIEAVLSAEQAPAGPFFVSEGQPWLMDDVLDAAERALGGDAAVRIPIPRRALRLGAPMLERLTGLTGAARLAARTLRELSAPAWGCLPTEATETFGWQPEVDLAAGLIRTVRWYREAGLI